MNAVRLLDYVNDTVAITITVSLIVGYQLYLRRLARRDWACVLASAGTVARRAWVEMVMSNHSDALLAVQTLRNTTMAASLLASTAILLIVGALTLTGQARSLQETWHFLNIFGTLSPELWLVKLLCILLLLFLIFFNFVNSIRVLNHVGYMVALREGPGTPPFSPKMVAAHLDRGSHYFRLGMRLYYYLVPFVFWLFGPIYMVTSACLMVFVLLPRIDRLSPDIVGRIENTV